jgi:hypothetical protein
LDKLVAEEKTEMVGGARVFSVNLFGFSETKTINEQYPNLIQLLRSSDSPKTSVSRRNHPVNQMAPKFSDRVEKKWVAKQLQHIASLKTVAGIQRFQKTVLEMLEDKTDTKPQSVRQYPVSRSIPKVLLLISSHLVNCKRYHFRPSSRDLRPEKASRLGAA